MIESVLIPPPDGAACAMASSLLFSELYIGNTSPDMTDIVLKDFLSSTMQKVTPLKL